MNQPDSNSQSIPEGAVPADLHPGLQRPGASSNEPVELTGEEVSPSTAPNRSCETPSCDQSAALSVFSDYPLLLCSICARSFLRFLRSQPALHEIRLVESKIKNIGSHAHNDAQLRHLEEKRMELKRILCDSVDSWLQGDPRVIEISPKKEVPHA